ncbi:hypothetical protein EON65_46855 [archaeon]|nr:MAG: hypothetical protein EON65_46855 [archaeon]
MGISTQITLISTEMQPEIIMPSSSCTWRCGGAVDTGLKLLDSPLRHKVQHYAKSSCIIALPLQCHRADQSLSSNLPAMGTGTICVQFICT